MSRPRYGCAPASPPSLPPTLRRYLRKGYQCPGKLQVGYTITGISICETVDRTLLHPTCGILQWLFKIQTVSLCMDLNRPPGTVFAFRQGQWRRVLDCFSDDLRFVPTPCGASAGSKGPNCRQKDVPAKEGLATGSLGRQGYLAAHCEPSVQKAYIVYIFQKLTQFSRPMSQLPPLLRPLRPLPEASAK